MAKKKTHRRKRTTRTALTLFHKDQIHEQFDLTEVYRQIRTNIEFSTVGDTIKSIALTSTEPKEAKTTTVINLGYVFATKYEKVLIIDCDLRKSQIHHYLDISNLHGLTDTLLDYSKTGMINQGYIHSIQDDEFVQTLDVLTAGSRVPNPTELLASDIFKKFMEELEKIYDFIIIDCPPVMSVADSIPVGHVVDGTLFVCCCATTNRHRAKDAINILKQNNVHILGTILTRADTYMSKYGYGYGYGYGYYYSDEN